MAAERATATALISEGPVKGVVMVYEQKIDEQKVIVLEVIPPLGVGLRHVTLQLEPEKAAAIAKKILALTGASNGP